MTYEDSYGDETPLPAANDAGPPAAASCEEDGDARARQLADENAKLKDQLLRALADAENIRKRGQREREDAAKYAATSFAKDMLDFADNFHRALAAIPAELRGDEKIAGVIAGIEAMEKTLDRAFEKHGITKMDPLDKPFDANFHEVIFEAPSAGKPAGIIIQVVETGYMLKDRLLRPARVGVAKNEGPNAGTRIDTQA